MDHLLHEGQTYSLTCDLVGDESLDVPDVDRSIRWDRLTPTFRMAVHRGAILSFTSLSRDDDGQYRCTQVIHSPYLLGPQTREQSKEIVVVGKFKCIFSL